MSEKLMRQVGKLVFTEVPRDALHVAVAPVEAGENMNGGDFIVVNNGVAMVAASSSGIVVDPWLKRHVNKGEKFLAFIQPGKIKSLTHHWEHPSFIEEIKKQKDYHQYMKELSRKIECPVSSIEHAAAGCVRNGSSVGGSQADWYGDVNWVEFWEIYNSYHKTNYNPGDDPPFCC